MDEVDAFVVGCETAFHGIGGHLFEVGEGEVEEVGREGEFLGHFGVAHEAVIGVEEDAEAGLVEDGKGVFFEIGAGSGVEITGEAHLDGDAAVDDESGEVAHFEGAIWIDGNVVHEPSAVAEAVSPAPLNGLPDRLGAVGFASMNGDGEVGALDGLEGFEVVLRREAIFAPSEIESNHALVTETDGELGGF